MPPYNPWVSPIAAAQPPFAPSYANASAVPNASLSVGILPALSVIDFVKAKQKLQNVKSSTTVLDEQVPIEDDDVFFEIIYDHDNDE